MEWKLCLKTHYVFQVMFLLTNRITNTGDADSSSPDVWLTPTLWHQLKGHKSEPVIILVLQCDGVEAAWRTKITARTGVNYRWEELLLILRLLWQFLQPPDLQCLTHFCPLVAYFVLGVAFLLLGVFTVPVGDLVSITSPCAGLLSNSSLEEAPLSLDTLSVWNFCLKPL